MDVSIKKDAEGRELASCKDANDNTQYLRVDNVYIRVHDGALMIGDGKGLGEASTPQEIALCHSFQCVKALIPIVKET